jgi:sec-independent protein translocase protein TatA
MGVGLISPWHVAILAIVLLLFFGPKRLPEMGRSLGKGMREFKDSISGNGDEEQPSLVAASSDVPVSDAERQTVA